MGKLDGKKVAFLLTNGYEDSELTSPWEAVTAEGAEAVLVSTESGEVEGKKGHTASVDMLSADARATDFDALVLPGGVANPDALRTDADAVDFVASFLRDDKLVASICHAPWTLIEAGAVEGRKMTSWPSLRTDLVNAGAEWVDEEVVVCGGGPGTLISSRKPDDVPAFGRTLVEQLAKLT